MMPRKSWRAALLVAAAAALAGCKGHAHKASASAGAATSAAPAVTDTPLMLYRQQCAGCHGRKGDGNGPMARRLPVRPANYTTQAWQESVSDAEIRAIVVKGGAAVGKSPLMPAHPALAKNPKLLKGLVRVIRSFAPPNGD